MTRGKRRGSRKPRVALAGAVAAVAAMAFAGTAQATTTPVAMDFDHGLVKLGGSGTPIDIVQDGGPDPVFTANVCTDTAGGCAAVGDFTIPIANWNFPPATSDVSGVPGETATFGLVPLVSSVTGHYNSATGALTTNAHDYRSDVTLAGPINGACTVSPINIAFSTAKTTPFQGDAFDVASSPPTNGVIDADWATLPTPADNPDVGGDDGSTCASVLNVFTTGAGGIALGQGIEPVLNTPPPDTGGGTVTPPPAAAPAKKKKCKKAKKKSASASKKSKCKKKKK
jgi:hypothetical protein